MNWNDGTQIRISARLNNKKKTEKDRDAKPFIRVSLIAVVQTIVPSAYLGYSNCCFRKGSAFQIGYNLFLNLFWDGLRSRVRPSMRTGTMWWG